MSDRASIDVLFDRARGLDALGSDDEARAAYLEVLSRSATHFGALTHLGTLLSRTGFPDAAHTALAEAVKCHPDNPVGHTALGMLLLDTGRIDAALAHLQTALSLDPNNLQAHQTLAILALRHGDRENARRHGEIGFKRRAEIWPYRGSRAPVRLLVLLSALGGNVGVERFIDDRVFLKSTIVAEFFDPETPLPPHDIVFNAIGDADRCREALEAVGRIVARTRAPVINRPERVLATGRASASERFASLPGVVTARTALLARETLTGAGAGVALAERGFGWPLLLRTPGYHTGLHFLKLEGPSELTAALAELPGSELLVIAYLDTHSPDGEVRKYRVMTVGGNLYPLHLAISTHWKIHYYSADMADSPAHRAEDEAFLEDMRGVLGARALAALQTISDVLALEYGGIDFGVDAAGRVLLFEANATMVIVPPAPDKRWAYRRAPVERVRNAVREMLVDTAARASKEWAV